MRSLRLTMLGAGVVVVGVALAAGVVHWGRSPRPQGRPVRPNVILITLDTTRADHCSCYGYERPTTPNLDDVAGAGCLFEAAYAPMATTGPAHASLFTSRYPIVHGVLKNGHVLAPDHRVLAETLREQGYETAAVVSSFAVDHTLGFAQGFDHYDDDFSDADPSYKFVRQWAGHEVRSKFDRRARQTTDKTIRWLRGRDFGKSFFLWVHYFDPHAPYDAPPRHRAQFPMDRSAGLKPYHSAMYDAELHYTDHEMGRLLEFVDSVSPADWTLVVIVGDHGEGLCDHGWWQHGLQIYEEAVRVPLVMRWPGRIPAGMRMTEPVHLVDLGGTVCALLGIPTAQDLPDVVNLAPALTGSAALAADRPVFVQRRLYESGRVRAVRADGVEIGPPIPVAGFEWAVRRGRWKYIEAPREGTRQLYDLVSDRGETRNRIGDHLPEADALRDLLRGWIARQRAASTAVRQDVSPTVQEKLESLGYINQ